MTRKQDKHETLLAKMIYKRSTALKRSIKITFKDCYKPAGHIVTGDLKIITDLRIRSIICKGPKYRFPVPIDFKSCREEIAGALQEFCNRWCKREHVESSALNCWKLNIF